MIEEQITNTLAQSDDRTALDEIFLIVREREDVDLGSYRPNTIERRVTSRLQKVRCRDYQEYATFLAGDANEARQLVQHVMIKVSRFFRDKYVFDLLRAMVLPELVGLSRPEGELRLWSAGCGNGEEAYSLAILADLMTAEGTLTFPAVIYATDIDQSALNAALHGTYRKDALAETPEDIGGAYFAQRDGRYGPEYLPAERLRSQVTFEHGDLLLAEAGPGGRQFHLVLCRNVLIYFQRSAQERVLSMLAGHVAPGGYLCLGEAEQLGKDNRLGFEVIDRKARLYRKLGQVAGERQHVA